MATRRSPSNTVTDVATFLTRCTHPMREELDALRAIVRAAAPILVESVKWNAPSYAIGADHVLTFNLSANDRVRIVFHRGAKKKDTHGSARMLVDSGDLLEWPADDRAIATFRGLDEVVAKQAELTRLVKAWVAVAQR